MDSTALGRKNGRAEDGRESFSNDGVQYFKKNELKPHLSKYWKIPPDQNASFVSAMEDVLAVYGRPYQQKYPVLCMDE